MKHLILAALLVGSALTGVASADSIICNEPWMPPGHSPHLPPCHPRPGGGQPASTSCGINSVAQEAATGGQDTFTGAAYGYVVAENGVDAVSIRCYVTVNGAEVTSTPTGSGSGWATTTGQVTYTAAEQDDVDICGTWTVDDGAGTFCRDVTTTQIPPQVVVDLLDLISSIPDPLICPFLGSLAPGVPGVVDITPEGDVTLLDPVGGVWDCPPYDL